MKQKSNGLFIVTLVLALIYVFPFAILIINSLKTKFEILKDPLALPAQFNLDNFAEAFVRMDYLMQSATH